MTRHPGPLMIFFCATLLAAGLTAVALVPASLSANRATTSGTATQISIAAQQRLGDISPLLYGFNHRFQQNGGNVWDTQNQQVYPEVLDRSQQIGFTIARFPGGTVSSTYHWTDGIGPPETRPPGISGHNGAPVTNEYGLDEQMLYMEETGATTNIVVNFGTGTAQEAAAFVAYANGSITDSTPIGVDELGVDWGTVGGWAAKREENQQRLGKVPHPYNIRYWEVGNELYGDWEYTWTHDPIPYALGGTAWHTNEPLVLPDDWRDRVSRSTGQSDQVFFVRYPPVVTGTQTVTVSGTLWQAVPDLAGAGPNDTVYTFDPLHGAVRFGDGVHGRVPPLGAAIWASYESGPHDGFTDYYAAMKRVDRDIKIGSCFTSPAFLQAMGSERPYDFLIAHLYHMIGSNDLATARLIMLAGPGLKQQHLQDLRQGIQQYAGGRADQVELLVTEYNVVLNTTHTPTPRYGMSLDQGLFIANMLRVMIEEGVTVGNMHALIGPEAANGGWGNTIALSPYPELIPRTEAYVLQLFSQHFESQRVQSEVSAAPMLTDTLPALTAVASTDNAGTRLTLLAINQSATDPITATLAISGFVPAPTAQVWTLNGPAITSYNAAGHPTDVHTVTSTLEISGTTLPYTFPAHSVTLIALQHAATTFEYYLPLVERVDCCSREGFEQ
ncbi:MAG: hypothetical protein GXP41_09635 [Chloroflexi bacterium]|nr:hypothetical protein [Chloroflexota bacterium]